eukprot:3985495-Pleurochrysis_carterae.AAC.4
MPMVLRPSLEMLDVVLDPDTEDINATLYNLYREACKSDDSALLAMGRNTVANRHDAESKGVVAKSMFVRCDRGALKRVAKCVVHL